MLHRVWQVHHVPPCVYLGRARPNDVWCVGCQVFIRFSEQAKARADQEESDRIRASSRH